MSLYYIGITVALAKADPMMESFGVLIVDEAYEHSADADILLGHFKDLLSARPELKIVVMSAAIDKTLFRNYLPQAVVEEVSGRRYKVTVNYQSQPPADLIAEIINNIFYVHLTQIPGDILVFVTGKWEIRQVIEGAKAAFSDGRFDVESMGPLKFYPFHGDIPVSRQTKAINAPQPQHRDGKLGRKVIVSTNSAETSLTIEGITHVIDSCKEKVNMWNPHTESWRLLEQPVSKASVLHRKGRAGRTSEGMAWLMCTERGYQEDLIEYSVPHFLQGDMLKECLTIMKLGHNPATFDYIMAPAPETVVKTLEILQQLGAIDHNGKLLSRGEELTAIPTNVFAALTILESPEFGCSDEVLSVLAMVEATSSGGSAFARGHGPEDDDKIRKSKQYFQHPSGDHLTLFNIYMAWRAACHKGETDQKAFLNKYMLDGTVLSSADGFRVHYLKSMKRIEFWSHCELRKDDPNYYTRILQALAAEHFLHAAKHDSESQSNEYQLVRSGMDVTLSEKTTLFHSRKQDEWVIYNDCSDNGTHKTLRVVSTIKPQLLVAAQPEYWWDAEFLPEGHIKEGLLQTLADMIGSSDLRPAGMPVGNWPDVEGLNWEGLSKWVGRCMAPHNKHLKGMLPAWQEQRDRQFAKVEQLKNWNLENAIAAGFDDGSSEYEVITKYCSLSLSIAGMDAAKVSQNAAQKKLKKQNMGGRRH